MVAAWLRLNPWHYIIDPNSTNISIPWVLHGAAIFNLVGSLVQASILHGLEDPAFRLETAFTGYYLLELGRVMAADLAQEKGVKRRTLWIDMKTHKTLLAICGSAICALAGTPSPVFWPALSERKLEKRFGQVRSRFGNSQMSISDYWKASALLMKKQVAEHEMETMPPQVGTQPILTSDKFTAISHTAFAACLRFAAMTSGRPQSDIRSSFTMHAATRQEEEDDECNGEDEDAG